MGLYDRIKKEENKTEKLVGKILANIDNYKVRRKALEQMNKIALCVSSKTLMKLISELINFPDGVEYFRENWKDVFENTLDGHLVISILSKDDEIRKECVEEFDFFIDHSRLRNINEIIALVSRFEGGENKIIEEFEECLKCFKIDYNKLFTIGLNTPEGREKVKQNFHLLSKRSENIGSFFDFVHKLEDEEGFEDEYEKYSFWADLYDMVKEPHITKLTEEEYDALTDDEFIERHHKKRKNNYLDTVFYKLMQSDDTTLEEKKMILQEVSNGNKFEYAGKGHTSLVLKTNNQVVKLMSKQEKFEIPYHPRIMMPCFRKKYTDGTALEIFNYANTRSTKITDKRLLEIYKELENDGIIWGDAKKDNLVVLLRDNELPDYIKSKNFNVFGFVEDARFPTTEHKALKKGEIVICDLDMIYAKDDKNIKHGPIDKVIADYIKSGENVKKTKRKADDGPSL